MDAAVAEAIRLTNQHYTSRDSSERSAAEAALTQNVKNNADLLLAILGSSASDQYAILYSSLAIVHWFKANLATLDVNGRRAIITVVLQAVQRLHSLAAPRHVCNAAMDALARLSKLTYDGDGTVPDAIGAALEMLNAQRTPAEVNLALGMLNSIVQECCLYDSSKASTYLTFAAHRRCSNGFRDTSLMEVFRAAMDQLARVNGTAFPNLNETLQLVKNTLNYDFMAIIVDETEDGLSAQYPASWKELILNRSLLDSLWGAHMQLPLPYCVPLMQAVGALCGVRRSFFDDQQEKFNFLNFMLGKIVDISNAQDGRLLDASYCTALSEACVRFISPYGYKDLQQIDAFNAWLAFMETFTCRVFGCPFGDEVSFNTTTTLLRFWTRLGNSKRLYIGDETRAVDVEATMPNCALTFFKSRVVPNPSTCDEDVLETIALQAELFSSLCSLETCKLMQELASYLTMVGDRAATPQCSVSLAWALHLCGNIVRSHFSAVQEDDIPAFSDFLTAAVKYADAARQVLGSVRSEMAMFIESSLLVFLGHMHNTFTSSRLVQGSGKVIARVFNDKRQMFQFFITAIGHNIMRPITGVHGGCDEKALVKTAIDLINDVCRDVPGEYIREMQLTIPPVVDLPISQSRETFKLRTNLCTALWAIRLPMAHYTLEGLMAFMIPVEGLMQMTMSGQQTDPLFVAGWLRDLRGISRAACASQQSFADFIEWILQRQEILIAISLTRNPPLITISLMRFIAELVTPSTAYGRVNVSTSSHSATGVLLFRLIAQVIQNVLSNSINDEMIAKVQQAQTRVDGSYEYMLKPIFIAMEVMRKCIHGDFVPFGAMAFYNDTTYDTTVVGMCKLLAVFPLYLFSQFSKVTLAAMDLLRSMTESSVFSPLAIMTTEDLLTLIDFALAIAQDTETKTSTLLYAMSFLGFIASLIKPTKAMLEERQRAVRSPALSPGPGRTPGRADHSTAASVQSSRHVRERIAEKLVETPALWTRLIHVAMNIVTCQDRALSSCTQVVFPIFEADPIFWETFAKEFVVSYAPEKQNDVANYVSALGQAAESQEKFFSEIFVFRAAIRKL